MLRGRILRDERTKPSWSDHLSLPCSDEIRAILLANIVKEDGPLPDPCWIWQGSIGIGGYGRMSFRGARYKAHRLAYRNLVGPFDKQFQINHRECNNPACINPEHLYVGTQKENVDDMWECGHAVMPDRRGESNGRAKLREKDIPEILQLFAEGHTQTKIATLKNIGVSEIGDVLSGKRWGWVPGPRPEPRTTSSMYRCVTWYSNISKWGVNIHVNGRRLHLGTFRDEVAAAKAYNDYVIAHGLDRPLNNLWSTPTLTEIPFADLDPEWLEQVGA